MEFAPSTGLNLLGSSPVTELTRERFRALEMSAVKSLRPLLWVSNVYLS
jgi:hypothetical protein